MHSAVTTHNTRLHYPRVGNDYNLEVGLFILFGFAIKPQVALSYVLPFFSTHLSCRLSLLQILILNLIMVIAIGSSLSVKFLNLVAGI